MAQIKLTISIGTYNRSQCIQRQVRDVLEQLEEGVQLYVFDNASDRPVSDLFTKEELSRFTIFRNTINIGRDQNQVRSLENVKEGWVWTLSDDDIIKKDAVRVVLKYINKHPKSCYINFGNKKESSIHNFQELTSYFSIVGTFGISFFQSSCVYNIDRIKKSLYWFNEFLSSQIGQICMVLKHMENNKGEMCLFTTTSIIEEVPPGGWSPKDFIINSSILFDKFHYRKRELKGTLFKGMGDMYFPMLSTKKCPFLIFVIYIHT